MAGGCTRVPDVFPGRNLKASSLVYPYSPGRSLPIRAGGEVIDKTCKVQQLREEERRGGGEEERRFIDKTCKRHSNSMSGGASRRIALWRRGGREGGRG
jgi:hypothetical protein